MGQLYSATVVSPEMSSEGQEVSIPIDVGIHLPRSKDLTYYIR